MQASESSTNGKTTETSFSDGCVDNPLRTETVQETSCYLVPISTASKSVSDSSHMSRTYRNPEYIIRRRNNIRSIVLRNLLTQDKGLLVGFQLLCQSLVQCITNSNLLSTARLCGVSLEAQNRRRTGGSLKGRAKRRGSGKQASCWTEETGSNHGRAEGTIMRQRQGSSDEGKFRKDTEQKATESNQNPKSCRCEFGVFLIFETCWAGADSACPHRLLLPLRLQQHHQHRSRRGRGRRREAEDDNDDEDDGDERCGAAVVAAGFSSSGSSTICAQAGPSAITGPGMGPAEYPPYNRHPWMAGRSSAGV